MGRPEVSIKRLLAAWMNKPAFERRTERGYTNRSNPRLSQDDGGLRLPFFDLLEFSLGSVFVLCEHNLKSLCTICPRSFGTDLRSGCSRPSGPFRVLNCWPAVSMYAIYNVIYVCHLAHTISGPYCYSLNAYPIHRLPELRPMFFLWGSYRGSI